MKSLLLALVAVAVLAAACGSDSDVQAEGETAEVQTSVLSETDDGASAAVPDATSAPTTSVATKLAPTTAVASTTTTAEPATQEDRRVQEATFVNLLTREPVEGSRVQITATEESLEIVASTVGLTPGHPVTAWLVFFNDFDECREVIGGGDCEPLVLHILGRDDLGNIGYAGGALVDDGGALTINGTVPTGPFEQGWWDTPFLTPLDGSYHVILMDHGPPVEGLVDEMLTSHRAGCTDDSIADWLPPSAHEDGTPGPNTCVEIHGVAFRPEAS